MSAIGGFFELELNSVGTNGSTFHNEAFKFNTGSSSLLFYLNNTSYKNVFIPYFTCQSVITAINKSKLNYQFYRLDPNLLPIVDYTKFDSDTLLIYNDYFGINNSNVISVCQRTNHVLVDAAQSFFYRSSENEVAYFNSLRKFFGVPDGSFLSLKGSEDSIKAYEKLEHTNYSTKHLIERIEHGAESAYQAYLNNEEILENNAMGKMSKLSIELLNNIDLNDVKSKRRSNYQTLHNKLGQYNRLSIKEMTFDSVPMCYPFLFRDGEKMRHYLINEKIFVPKYWPKIEATFNHNCEFEIDLLNNLVCLPIDQRYGKDEMDSIIEYLTLFLNE